MSEGDDGLRDELQRRLLQLQSKLPTSSLGRLGRTALTALRGGRLAWRGRSGAEAADIEDLAAIVSAAGQLKGVAMKAGQLMSYLDLAVPPEIQSALAVLQTHSPPMPYSHVVEIVERDLGDRAGPLLARMHKTPAAAASIGQVHRAILPDGTDVAVKVQYPHIEQAIESDFRSAAVGKHFVGLLAPGANVAGIVNEARRAILEECDYGREADYQQRFGEIYREHATLSVPAVHTLYCSRHVLTTTWCEGLRFDDFLHTHPPQDLRDRLGQAVFEFYVGTLFRHGLYNWDPHPGNYIVRGDGTLAMLDYGSTREFEASFVRKLAALTRAVHQDTREALHATFLDLGLIRPDKPYDFETARTLVRAFYGPMLRDEVVTIEPGGVIPFRTFLAKKRELLRLHLPGELLFLLRIRFGVMSVLARLGPRANWYRLERSFAAAAESSQPMNATTRP